MAIVIIFILIVLVLCDMFKPKFTLSKLNGETYLILWYDIKNKGRWYRNYMVILRL